MTQPANQNPPVIAAAPAGPETIPFTKMQGIGNDYVYVNCFEQSLAGHDVPALSRRISDRNLGVGSDGLILITRPEAGIEADVRMEMYNADGSRGEMCGNGLRCVAKYALDYGLVSRSAEPGQLRVQTDAGVKCVDAWLEGGRVNRVRVDMGSPILEPADIPVALPTETQAGVIRAPLRLPGADLQVTCVSMGNPHAVMFLDAPVEWELERVGPLVEHHEAFPHRVNFHVVELHGRSEATMRTWERGSGITQACGSGACAVLVAGVQEDRLERTALIHLPGGDLKIEWAVEGHVLMTGPAAEVFHGAWPIA